ncbi:MAG: sugar phosphate nucleotidyltransferase [Oscillospiraceae bacterium]|nr:sugar phosphate nucleotidyltransferase [Oscillospiraceae bacterium]
MKALLLNSGIGKRMGALTANKPKAMLELGGNTTIISRQIEQLLAAGIRDFVVTTGPFGDMLEGYLREQFTYINFQFVKNSLYASTNYIYSIFLGREFLRECEILLLHGDLVFESRVLELIIKANTSVMTVDSSLSIPEKDFKAAVKNGKIIAVGTEIHGAAAQPLYKLTEDDWSIWLESIEDFCRRGERGVYAENALNAVSWRMNLRPLNLNGLFCAEVDTPEDYSAVRIQDTGLR